MKMIYRILLNALALLVIAYYIPGITVSGVYIAIVAAVVLGVLNAFVRPILFVLTLPITIITLGLFTFYHKRCCFGLQSFLEGLQ